jgi:F0F1-type ATP synthase assembly protein I
MALYLRKRGLLFLTGREGRRYTSHPMTGGPQRGDAWSGMGTGWSITATMIAGILVWGGFGYLVDRLVGTMNVFLAFGVILGAGCGVYLVYLRYGRGEGGRD